MSFDTFILFHKEQQYRAEWKDLLQRQVNLDYAVSKLMATIRSHFPKGTEGDRYFIQWITLKLEPNETKAYKLLERAQTFKLIGATEQTWGVLGGSKQATKLTTLPVNIQKKVVELAKSQNTSINDACKTLKVYPTIKVENHKDNAAVLARFIKHQVKNIPASIQEVLKIYGF